MGVVNAVIHAMHYRSLFWFVWFLFYGYNLLGQGCIPLLIHSLFEDVFLDRREGIIIGDILPCVLLSIGCLHTHLESTFVHTLIESCMRTSALHCWDGFLIYEGVVHLLFLDIHSLIHDISWGIRRYVSYWFDYNGIFRLRGFDI